MERAVTKHLRGVNMSYITPDIGEEMEDNQLPYWKDKRRRPSFVYTTCVVVETILVIAAIALAIFMVGIYL